MRQACHDASLHGNRQWELVDWFPTQPYQRKVFIGRRVLAKKLGGRDERNTQRRLHRLEQLGILRIVRGGGRVRGCRKDDRRGLRGRANRYYPGARIVDPLLVAKWIEADDKRELDQAQSVVPPRDDAPPAPAQSFRELADRFSQPRAGP